MAQFGAYAPAVATAPKKKKVSPYNSAAVFGNAPNSDQYKQFWDKWNQQGTNANAFVTSPITKPPQPRAGPSGQGPAGVTPMMGGAAGTGPMGNMPGMAGAASSFWQGAPGQAGGMQGAGMKPYQVVNAGTRSEGYYDQDGRFHYGQPPQGSPQPGQAPGMPGQPIPATPEMAPPGSPGGAPPETFTPGGKPAVPSAGAMGTTPTMPQYNLGNLANTSAANQLAQYQYQLSQGGLSPQEQDAIRSRIQTIQRRMDFDNWMGQYMQGIQSGMGSNVSIEDIPGVQENPQFRAALQSLGQNPSPAQLAQVYQQFFPESYDFSLGEPGYQAEKGQLGPYQGVEIPGIERGEDITIGQTGMNKTDIEALMGTKSATANEEMARKAAEQRLTEAQKMLQGGGMLSQEEQDKLLAGMEQASRLDEQAAWRDVAGQLAAEGRLPNAAAVLGGRMQVAQRFGAERKGERANLQRQMMEQAFGARKAGMETLGDIARGEREAAATERGQRIEAAGLGSREKIAEAEIEARRHEQQAQMQLAQDTLFQEGQLTASGQELQQALGGYGLNLDKYKTDQGFDLEMARQDLQERIADQTGNMQAAKLQADNIFKSIEAGMEERQLDQQRDSQIAQFEMQAAQGDQDSKYKVQALRLEQDLRQQGLDNEMTRFVGDLMYRIQSGREQMDQNNFQFLKQLDLELKKQGGGGIGGFLGGLIGTGLGALAGGAGAGVGGALGEKFGSLFDKGGQKKTSGGWV